MKNKKVMRMLLLFIIGMPIITQYACTDDNKAGGNYDGPLRLKSFYPDSGYLSSKIIIEAENLGTDVSNLSVYFNKKKAFISKSVGNLLMVYAPKLPGDTCIISVVKGKDSLTFDSKFRYITRFTVANVCGQPAGKLNLGVDLSSTAFDSWILKVGCCDPEGNYYASYANFGSNTGGLALISEKNNLSKQIIKTIVNDVMYCKEKQRIYALATKRNVIYEIDPANDWKVKNCYLKLPAPPAKQVDYANVACIAYCSANDYFYARTATNQFFRFKLDDMVCEYINNSSYGQGIITNENSYIISMMFDPTEPTKLYTSHGATAVITLQDVANSKPDETVYAGQFNQGGVPGNILNGYRTDCLLRWNNQMTIIADGSGQKNMYIADAGTQTIRKLDMNTGLVTCAVGIEHTTGSQIGSPEEATFNWPKGVGLTPEGDLFISDCGSGYVRKLTMQ